MGRSVAAQSQDNRKRAAAGQPRAPITYDSGPPARPVDQTKPTYDASGQAMNNPAKRVTGQLGKGVAPKPVAGSGNDWTPNSKPGYGENWYAQNGYKWNQPSPSATYWNGVQGQFNGPTSYEAQMRSYGNELGGNRGATENLYDQYNKSGEFTNPSAAEDWWTQNQGQYNAPSFGEQSLNNVIGQYGQTGAAEDWYNQNQDFYKTSGDMENFYRGNAGALQNNNNLRDNAGGIANDINSAKNMQRFYGATAGDLAMPGYTENLADQYRPEASYSENFLTGGAGEGLDQLYGRLFSKGARSLDNAAAARGGFNSGASLRAQEELGADMNAQQVRDTMQLTNQADSQKMNRLGYGLDLMKGADAGLTSRIGLGYQGAQGADNTALGRAAASQNLYTGMSDELRSNITTGGDLANKSQSSALARMTEGGNAANSSNVNYLNRLSGLTTASNDSADQWRNRMNDSREGAKTATDAWKSRMDTGMNASNTRDDQWRGRLNDAGNAQGNAFDMWKEQLGLGGNLSNLADQNTRSWLEGGQASANSAQNQQQGRENSVYNNVSDLGGKQANTYGQGMDKIRDEQRQSMMDEINGIISGGGITSQQIMAEYGEKMQTLGLVIQGGRVVAGNLAGGGAKAPTATPPNVGGGMPGYGASTAPVTEGDLFPYKDQSRGITEL